MADKTTIEWTRSSDGTPGATWNPVTGCSVVSPGCTNCYAMKLAGTRLRHHPSRAGLTVPSKAGPVWNGKVRLNEEWLDQPLRWRRPRMIFVCAHGDLFHESVPEEWIDRVFAVMALAPQHTFQVLTKRAARMRAYLSSDETLGRMARILAHGLDGIGSVQIASRDDGLSGFALPNVWLGVSAEDQQRADERVPALLATPATVRFVSAEPLLGPIEFTRLFMTNGKGGAGRYNALSGEWRPGDLAEFSSHGGPRLDWIIVGGESIQRGKCRPFSIEWARSLIAEGQAAGRPVFMKQLGTAAFLDGKRWKTADRAGADPDEWPDDIRIREMPRIYDNPAGSSEGGER